MQRIQVHILWGMALLVLMGIASTKVLAQADTRTPVQFPGRTTRDDADDRRNAQDQSQDPSALLADKQASRFSTPDVLEGVLSDTDYILGPLDYLSITIAAGKLRTETVPVLPEGVVVIPNIGVVSASGSSLAEFRQALHKAVSKRYQNFELYCHLARAREVRVFVTGEVNEPGTVVAKTYERVADLIERASGFSDFGSQRNIELKTVAGDLLQKVDLAPYYANADMTANPPLGNGQVIYVPTRTREVEVIGQVARPGVHELREGEKLSELLSLVGGPLQYADMTRVTVDVLTPDGVADSRTYDATQIDPALENVVRVTVLSSLIGHPRVVVISPDGTRRTFFLAPGDSLRELSLRIGDFDENAQLDMAVLASSDADGLPISVPVDLTAVLHGDSNHVLRDRDVLSIPGPRDFVYVTGFVQRPGQYPYRSDFLVGHYVGSAGGTARGGNLTSARVFHLDGSESKLLHDDPLQRGDTIYVDRSTGGKWVAGLAILSNFSALIISVVALTR